MRGNLQERTGNCSETVFSQQGTSFRRVGLVTSARGAMVAGLHLDAAGRARETGDRRGRRAWDFSLSCPARPGPTTGFCFYLPARDVIEIDMTPDDAAKLIAVRR